ncbi:hypothetical protein BDV95DRAFT_473497, partial [Massariosphaeria phaeospora]
MGRTEKSQGLAPPTVRKDIRAKQARHIINKTIPAILASNSKARKGADESELIVDPGPIKIGGVQDGVANEGSGEIQYLKRKGQGKRKIKGGVGDNDMASRAGHEGGYKGKVKGKRRQESIEENLSQLSLQPPQPSSPTPELKIRILATDTLTAAQTLKFSATKHNSNKKHLNICILNMASPLRPGGGVLSGATSQEEFLCARTTLLPSLKESFYRLPELGGIFTPNVLVFRSAGPLGSAKSRLGPGERYWVDVVSAGMLRFPELEGGEEETRRLGKNDREAVEKKMRAVLRIACQKEAKKLVLGAWGCGAYGNPVTDIAQAWRKVLDGETNSGKKSKNVSDVERWNGVEEVIFAVSNEKMAAEFAKAFGKGIEVEKGPDRIAEDEEEDDEEDQAAEELKAKIGEMESQLALVWNPDLKARMGVILDGLRAQLQERE